MKTKLVDKITLNTMIFVLFLDVLMFCMLGFMLNNYILIKQNLISINEINVNHFLLELDNTYIILVIFILSVIMHSLICYFLIRKIFVNNRSST